MEGTAADTETILFSPTARQRECIARAQQPLMSPVERVCANPTCIDRLQKMSDASQRDFCLDHVHFVPHLLPHTLRYLGECNWNNRCIDINKCAKMHWRMIPAASTAAAASASTSSFISQQRPTTTSIAAQVSQWVTCDISKLDLSALGGSFDAVMADPPWSISMDLKYGLMSDEDIVAIDLGQLQQNGGYAFIFVRATLGGGHVLLRALASSASLRSLRAGPFPPSTPQVMLLGCSSSLELKDWQSRSSRIPAILWGLGGGKRKRTSRVVK
jgi:hypothetical protein